MCIPITLELVRITLRNFTRRRTVRQAWQYRYNFWKGCPKKIWEVWKRPKFGAIADNFRLWSQITEKYIDKTKIWKASDQLQLLSCWGLKIWWTLVHKQNSYRHACWPTQLDFFGRLYFGPCGCCPLKFIHAIPYHPWVVYPVGLGVLGIFLVWFCYNN